MRPALYRATGAGPVTVTLPSGEVIYSRHLAAGDAFTVPDVGASVDGAVFVRHLRRPNGRRRHRVGAFVVATGDNPHTASVWPDGSILVDTSFWALPFCARVFVLLHEAAHQWYKTEEACDAWAAREMRRAGFTPSQVYYGAKASFGHHADRRRERVEDLARKFDLLNPRNR